MVPPARRSGGSPRSNRANFRLEDPPLIASITVVQPDCVRRPSRTRAGGACSGQNFVMPIPLAPLPAGIAVAGATKVPSALMANREIWSAVVSAVYRNLPLG